MADRFARETIYVGDGEVGGTKCGRIITTASQLDTRVLMMGNKQTDDGWLATGGTCTIKMADLPPAGGLRSVWVLRIRDDSGAARLAGVLAWRRAERRDGGRGRGR